MFVGLLRHYLVGVERSPDRILISQCKTIDPIQQCRQGPEKVLRTTPILRFFWVLFPGTGGPRPGPGSAGGPPGLARLVPQLTSGPGVWWVERPYEVCEAISILRVIAVPRLPAAGRETLYLGLSSPTLCSARSKRVDRTYPPPKTRPADITRARPDNH